MTAEEKKLLILLRLKEGDNLVTAPLAGVYMMSDRYRHQHLDRTVFKYLIRHRLVQETNSRAVAPWTPGLYESRLIDGEVMYSITPRGLDWLEKYQDLIDWRAASMTFPEAANSNRYVSAVRG